MRRIQAIFHGACLGGLLFAPAAIQATDLATDGRNAPRTSADTAPPQVYAPGLERAVTQFRSAHPAGAASGDPLRIVLIFHVLAGAASEGALDEAILRDQVAVLDAAFAESGMRFTIAQVRRYPDSPYFDGGCFPTTEQGLRMKAELAVDPSRFVNIYTCNLALPYIAGYASLPNEFSQGDPRHGVIVDHATFPGSAAPLNRGHTLVHEMGHYFGLFHTFQGGCAEPGDGVDDTPAEASPAYGCQVGRDSCPGEGADPVDNFMDYSDDDCTGRFTAAQGRRMRAAIATYRPSLASAGFAIGPGMTGNWYNAAQNGHGFSLEVLPGNQLLAQWYTFAPGGGAEWIVGVGPISGNTAVLDAHRQVGEGGRFPPHFDPARVHGERWGTLRFTFSDCATGEVAWQSVLPDRADGAMPITRLTLPAGLSCP